eukprot:TRINITY_DN3432_c0_g1_i1.p1 TRINITY_DN3432_c0_g1~~TRINITY_DN3432_c0_g1_i1.p1  ORF type:complete len:861 (-),score=116.92 TRINITY_DN3432_c0_g1_i1:200-2725(-)
MESELEREEVEANAAADSAPAVNQEEANKRVACDILENLRARFPDLSAEIVESVLTKADGHGGKAAQELRKMSLQMSTPPVLARLCTPPSAGDFPGLLGPFALVATSFTTKDFRMASQRRMEHSTWTMSPGSLRGPARRAAGELCGAARIAGRLSPEHPVTLPQEDRHAAGIPDDAITFAWSYPIEQPLDVPSDCASNPDLTFLALGGFVYFSSNKRITKALALVPSSSGGLRFGKPFPLTQERITLFGKRHFRPVTIDEMRRAGARQFAWVRPGDFEELEHGGFAYIFAGGRSNICFPVCGQDETVTPDDGSLSAMEPPAVGAEPQTDSKGKLPTISAEAPWDLQANLVVSPPMALPSGTSNEASHHVLVSVKPPAGAASQTSSICVVLDVSGSMRTEATLVGSDEKSCLSLLDIAKHGIRTLIHTLGSQDKLALVTFNNRANVIFTPMLMNEAGRRKAEERLETLQAQGGTNIWEGLHAGLRALLTCEEKGVFDHIMLLTDGYTANAGSVMDNLVQYKNAVGKMPCSINTFGFGYRLDSAMLASIASEGTGSYSFIPDAGFIGTVFVNCVSNLLVTMARDVYVNLEVGSGAEIVSHELLGYEAKQEAGYVRVRVGNLQFGQDRDITVPLKIGASGLVLNANGQYCTSADGRTPVLIPRVAAEDSITELQPEMQHSIERNRLRVLLVDTITRSMAQVSSGTLAMGAEAIACLTAQVAESAAVEDKWVQALLADLTGQVCEAFSRMDWYQKWGVHYLPSLVFAHKLQQCNNFKDPGVQLYGGEIFETVRDEADDTFNSLPPPKPSLQPAPTITRTAADPVRTSAPAPQAISMAAYNNCCCG